MLIKKGKDSYNLSPRYVLLMSKTIGKKRKSMLSRKTIKKMHSGYVALYVSYILFYSIFDLPRFKRIMAKNLILLSGIHQVKY